MAYSVWKYSNKMPWYYKAIWVLGFLYPLGKTIQFWGIGPAVLRGYVSDLGFIACLTCLISLTKGYSQKVSRNGIIVAAFGLAIAVIMEVFQLLANSRLAGKGFGPRGDWVDMFIFFLTFLVVLYLLIRVDTFFAKIDRYRQELLKKQKSATRRERKKLSLIHISEPTRPY